MEDYAKRLTDADFGQFYQMVEALYYSEDTETLKHYFQLAEKTAKDIDKYKLVDAYRKIYQQEKCNEKVIDYYRQSMLAGSTESLVIFAADCKTEPAAQNALIEGLQHLEQQVNEQINSWQGNGAAQNKNIMELLDHLEWVRLLAVFYSRNYPALESLQKAEYYYLHMIEAGDSSRFNTLGNMWLGDISLVDKNQLTESFSTYCQKAQHYFEQASEHNQLDAILQLVKIYLDDDCGIKNEEKSLHYQEKLVSLVSNNKTTDNSLYLLVLADELRAMEYFAQAKKYAQQLADQDYHGSMPLLAELWLVNKDGLESDEQKAKFWYEKYFAHFSLENQPGSFNFFQAGLNFKKAGFNETADSYFKRGAELLGDEKMQRLLQNNQIKLDFLEALREYSERHKAQANENLSVK